MTRPSRVIPDTQARAFDRAVCERLGINPEIVRAHDFRAHFDVSGDEELGELHVTLTAYIPADEILAMFNGAGRKP